MAKILKGLSETIKDYSGEALKDQVGKPVVIKNILANALALIRSKEPIKMIALGLKIYNCDGEVELEEYEFGELKRAVEELDLSNITKAAILNIFEQSLLDKKE